MTRGTNGLSLLTLPGTVSLVAGVLFAMRSVAARVLMVIDIANVGAV